MGIIFVTIKVLIVVMAIIIPLIILLTHYLRVGKILLPKAGIVYAVAMLPIAYLFSYIFASNQHTALLGLNFNTDSLIVILLGSLSFLTIVLVRINEDYLKWLNIRKLLVYLASFIIAVFTIKLFWQTIGTLPTWFASFSIVESWVDISAFVALLIVMMMSCKATYPNGKLNYVKIVVISFLSILLTVFVNVVTIVGIVATLALLRIIIVWQKNKGAGLKKSVFVLPAAVLIITGIFVTDDILFNAKLSNSVQNLTRVSFVDVRPNWQGTLTVAKGTVSGADLKAKLFGPGAGSFADQWRMYKPIAVNSTNFWSTNFNYAIGFIPTSIITGGVFMSMVWIILLFLLVKLVLVTSKSKNIYPVLFIWLLLLFNPVDFILLIVAFILSGLLVAESVNNNKLKAVKYKIKGEGLNKSVTYIVLPIILVSSIFVLTVVGHRAIVNIYLVRASNFMLAQNSNSAEQLLAKAKMLTDLAVIEQGYTKIALSKLSILLANADKDKGPSKEETQEALSNVLSHARSAIEKDPTDPTNYIALGIISEQLINLKIDGAQESAVAVYNQAMKLDPLNPSIPLALARLATLNKEEEKYVSYLEMSLRIKPNYIPALYQYALVKLSKDDKKSALQMFSTIVQLDNRNANALYYMSLLLADDGQPKQALAVMQRVQSLNKDNKQVADIVESLKESVKTLNIDGNNSSSTTNK